MISSKRELKFYLYADRMMNRGSFRPSFLERIKGAIMPDYTIRWLSAMRRVSFYRTHRNCFLYGFWLKRYNYLSIKLGYSIGVDTFGYGLVVPHFGTIVVGDSNRIGNYAVLHTSCCIVDSASIIGDGLYLSTGSIISKHVELGDNITIAANSTLMNSFTQNNVLVVGSPAIIKKGTEAWYVRDGEKYSKRIEAVEDLKQRLLKSM